MKFGLLTVVISIILLTGCNTIKGTFEGAGKDVHAVTHPNDSSNSQQTSKSYSSQQTYKNNS